MTEFLTTALTFPTLVWSVLFAFCVVYWLLAATGLMDIDLQADHFDMGGHDFSLHGDGHHAPETSAGVLARFGLGGVPTMLALAIVAFIGWIVTYFVHLLVLSALPGSLRWILGAVTAIGALIPGVLVASLLLRPVRKLIARLRPPVPPSLLGRVGTVTTPLVDTTDGMAAFDDGGAGLILQVRAKAPDTFRRGDRVVLLEYQADDNSYRVMAEDRFNR